jgi:hypothetical protein
VRLGEKRDEDERRPPQTDRDRGAPAQVPLFRCHQAGGLLGAVERAAPDQRNLTGHALIGNRLFFQDYIVGLGHIVLSSQIPVIALMRPLLMALTRRS